MQSLNSKFVHHPAPHPEPRKNIGEGHVQARSLNLKLRRFLGRDSVRGGGFPVRPRGKMNGSGARACPEESVDRGGHGRHLLFAEMGIMRIPGV